MFEHAGDPLAPPRRFAVRLLTSTGVGAGALFASLVAGMAGFHYIERLSWIDSFLNAAMLLGGQGPLDHPRTSAGKLFEGIYAIYCGIAVITAAGIIFAPVLHRFLHRLHRERRGTGPG